MAELFSLLPFPGDFFFVFFVFFHFHFLFYSFWSGENNFVVTEVQPVVFMVWGQSVPTDGHKPCGCKRSQEET